jgi:hypothetical protein
MADNLYSEGSIAADALHACNPYVNMLGPTSDCSNVNSSFAGYGLIVRHPIPPDLIFAGGEVFFFS